LRQASSSISASGLCRRSLGLLALRVLLAKEHDAQARQLLDRRPVGRLVHGRLVVVTTARKELLLSAEKVALLEERGANARRLSCRSWAGRRRRPTSTEHGEETPTPRRARITLTQAPVTKGSVGRRGGPPAPPHCAKPAHPANPCVYIYPVGISSTEARAPDLIKRHALAPLQWEAHHSERGGQCCPWLMSSFPAAPPSSATALPDAASTPPGPAPCL